MCQLAWTFIYLPKYKKKIFSVFLSKNYVLNLNNNC